MTEDGEHSEEVCRLIWIFYDTSPTRKLEELGNFEIALHDFSKLWVFKANDSERRGTGGVAVIRSLLRPYGK